MVNIAEWNGIAALYLVYKITGLGSGIQGGVQDSSTSNADSSLRL